MTWWTWLRPAPKSMSAAWLAQINKPSSRVEFHGVSIHWPIQKRRDASPVWNAYTLKKRA